MTTTAKDTSAMAEPSAQDIKVNWSTPLTWVQSIPEDFDDLTSFKHMMALAQGKLDAHERIGKEIPSHLRKVEWDDVFEDDNNGYREAIRLIRERLTNLGHDADKIASQIATSPLYHGAPVPKVPAPATR